MNENKSSINALKDVLENDPNNTEIRVLLADLLLKSNNFKSAEKELLIGLNQAPDNRKIKLALAECFFLQGKNTHALILVEDLLKYRETLDPKVTALHSKLLLHLGNTNQAVKEFTKTITEESLSEPLETEIKTEEKSNPSLKSKICFKDVGGIEEVKEQIRLKIIYPIKNSDIYKAYGKSTGGGILLYGPPGCGKTLLARATAGEIDAEFITVGIHDVLDMWVGSSERNIHQIFETARNSTPCVLFFDEVDALAASREDLKHSAGKNVINQFLTELDGVNSSNEGILVLAATNAPWHLDSAFRRPGRFDRIIFVPPPNKTARVNILKILCDSKPTTNIDFDEIANLTNNYSGADLKALVEMAIEEKITASLKNSIIQPLSTSDLKSASKKVKVSCSEWMATAKNYALYSNQGGTYDEILKYLNQK